MCGICGLIANQPLSPELLEMVAGMNTSMVHRGPDGTGEFHADHVALGMRRLSIIDLNGGWQPLYNEDRSLVLIANGEIYNYIELRAQLQQKDHHFATGSDCETILHLYEEYGVGCIQYLRGMFAFALWDSSKRRLLLARDRLGEKPLYLYHHNKQLIFASELKSLISSGLVPFELDADFTNLYFHYQYIPEPDTILKGVRKLPAGHFLVANVDSWEFTESCYWRMEEAPALTGDPAEIIRAELETVSELVVRSDVPVGVALSGGLDSSAVAALAVRKYPGVIHAFSVGYPGYPRNDERMQAKALADYLKIPFHDIELTIPEMVTSFPELIYWRDDPITDISGYGYYSVMKLAREHNVPVVLQGQGGDELFWGYSWVRRAARASMLKDALWQKNGGFWSTALAYMRPEMPDNLNLRALYAWSKDIFGFRSGYRNWQMHYANNIDQMNFYNLSPYFYTALTEVKKIYTVHFLNQLNENQVTRLFTFPKPWPQIDIRITRLIIESYLQENGITQGDRLSMASSIELRLPLLDYKLVETVIGLRKTYKDYHLPSKSWFRGALCDILPEWVMNRPKQGFAPPIQQWYTALFKAYGEKLCDGYLVQSGVLDPEQAQNLAVGISSSGDIIPLSFEALVLEMWCRHYV